MKITVIGAGNMGRALVCHLEQQHTVTLCRRGDDLVEGVRGADWVLLAVKPKDIETVAKDLQGILQDQLLISVLAGVKRETLHTLFPGSPIVRMMPNLAITVQKGILGVVKEGVSSAVKEQIEAVFSLLGEVLWIEEKKMEAFSSLAASSPAFFFVLLEAFVEAGIELGFSSQESKKIGVGVWEGVLAMIAHSPTTAWQEWKWQVTSPGGTTIEGIKELEENRFRIALWRAIAASYKKAVELTKT